MKLRAGYTQPAFRGVSVMNEGEGLALFVRGSNIVGPAGNKCPYSLGTLDVNSAAILHDDGIETLTRRLESGENVPEAEIRGTLLKAVENPAPDEGPLREHNPEPDFQKVMRQYYESLRKSLGRLIRQGSVLIEPPDSPMRLQNDVYVSIRGRS